MNVLRALVERDEARRELRGARRLLREVLRDHDAWAKAHPELGSCVWACKVRAHLKSNNGGRRG